MTIEEAIDILKRLRIAMATKKVDGFRILEPLSVGIEALEKQIAKKPLKITTEYDGDYGHCPNCDGILADYSDTRVCKSCGQKLDWGKE